MNVRFKLDKGTALPIGNALRHLAMSKLPAWRPIAIGLNRKFNTIHATSNIVEDTFRIASNFSKFQYSAKSDFSQSFLKERFSFTNSFSKKDFTSEFFDVLGEEVPLITSLDNEPVELTILYRKGIGIYSSMDNSQFILDNGEIPENYFVMSSRHTEISRFTYNVSEDSSFTENLDILIESETRSGEDLLEEAVEALKQAVNGLEVKKELIT